MTDLRQKEKKKKKTKDLRFLAARLFHYVEKIKTHIINNERQEKPLQNTALIAFTRLSSFIRPIQKET